MAALAGTPDAQRTRTPDTLYDQDYYMWTTRQADALRRRDFGAIDWENVTKEIEALVTGQESSLKSQYIRIMEHFLKLQYWEANDTYPVAGWEISVQNARIEIKTLLEDSPALKGRANALFQQAWPMAKLKAITALVNSSTTRIADSSIRWREQKRLRREWDRVLPSHNPYALLQAENLDWMPQRAALPHRPDPLPDRPR